MPTCGAPAGSSASGPRSASRQGFGSSSAGTRRPMDVSRAHLVEQARVRCQRHDEYDAALALGPAFHDLRYKLGRMLLEAGRALDAREHFEIIVRARPNYLDAAAMLGLACYLAGDGLAAKAVWEDCRERRPEDPR